MPRYAPTCAGFIRTCLVASAVLSVSCGHDVPEAEPWISDSFLVMGGIEVRVTVPADEKDRLPACAREAREVMSLIERDLSKFRAGSEISRIVDNAGVAPVPVSPITLQMLVIAGEYAEVSGGAFDVTVAPLMPLWGFGNDEPIDAPGEDAVHDALARVGAGHLVVKDGTAFLEIEGMGIDLGGIAKGYAVDRACDRIASVGMERFRVNLGGNIRCIGLPEGSGSSWRIGVRDPFSSDRGTIVGSISLDAGMATATSGNYERSVEIRGERFSHIIDPRTGYPVKGMAAVTVICTNATQADAMSTALFVLGMEKGAALAAATQGCAALFIPDRQPTEIWLTPAMNQRFSPLPIFTNRVFLLE